MRKFAILVMAGALFAACSDDPDDPIDTGCDRASDCDTGELCVDRVCVPDDTPTGCQGPSDCDDGESCVNSMCVPDTTPECTGPSDCDEGEICVDNVCTPDEDVTPAECAPQDAPENGSVDQPEQPETGDTADFACDEGYFIVGDQSLLCGSDGTWSGDAPVCGSCDAYDAESFAFSKESAADPEVTTMVGFDLDGHVTTAVSDDDAHPDNGCNIVDAEDGVDNSLGAVLSLLALLGLDVETAISDLIGDALLIETRIQTISGTHTMDILIDGVVVQEGLEVTENEDGTLEAATDVFVLSIEQLHLRDVEDDLGVITPVYVDIRLTLNNARFQIDPVSGALLVGGVLVYGEEGSGQDTFRPNVVNILKALEDAGVNLPVDQAAVDSIFMGSADMALDGETCQDLSFGMLLPGTVGVCE